MAENVNKWVEKACKWVVGGSIVNVVDSLEQLSKIKTTETIQLTTKVLGDHPYKTLWTTLNESWMISVD